MTCKERFILVSVGDFECLKSIPSEKKWRIEYDIDQKQAIAGVVFFCFEKIAREAKAHQSIILEWIGLAEQIKSMNLVVNQRLKVL